MAHVLIVEARFYDHLNDLLLSGARAAIEEAGHSHETITVPGALEIPGAVAMAADTGRYDAFVAIGVVIQARVKHLEPAESARAAAAAICKAFDREAPAADRLQGDEAFLDFEAPVAADRTQTQWA